jgi:hypothetical protein
MIQTVRREAAVEMLNDKLRESAATGCARASDEFRTFNIQNSTLSIMVTVIAT